MKHFLSILTFCVCINLCFAQSENTQLEKDFNNYIQLTFSKQYEATLDYMMEEIFNIITKENLIEILKNTFDNDETIINLKNPKIIEIGKTLDIENKLFNHLKFQQTMEIKFLSDDEELNNEEKNNMLLNMLKAQFGENNVSHNNKTDFFSIENETYVIAYAEKNNNRWKFINYDTQQQAFLQSFIPQEILNRL